VGFALLHGVGKGETELAIQNYKRSLEINPDNQNAKDQLKKNEKRLSRPS
jgi:hypothetical protein